MAENSQGKVFFNQLNINLRVAVFQLLHEDQLIHDKMLDANDFSWQAAHQSYSLVVSMERVILINTMPMLKTPLMHANKFGNSNQKQNKTSQFQYRVTKSQMKATVPTQKVTKHRGYIYQKYFDLCFHLRKQCWTLRDVKEMN